MIGNYQMIPSTNTKLYSLIISKRNITLKTDQNCPQSGLCMIHDRIKLLHTTMMVRWSFVIVTWSYCSGKYPLQLEFYTLFLMFPTHCVLTFHFLIFWVIVVTQNNSCIITCMITDCLSTNTVLPIIIDKQCLTGYRAKMIKSLQTNIIETGYSRPVEGPTLGPGTVQVIIAEVMENLLSMVVKKIPHQRLLIQCLLITNTQI